MTRMGRSKKSDIELVLESRRGNELSREVLFERYENLIRSKVYKYFINGGDSDDLYQEAMIGFNNAIDSYQELKSNFGYFANICIERHLITRITAANRLKHIPLNDAFSLDRSVGRFDEDDNSKGVMDIIYVSDVRNNSYGNNPSETFVINEVCKTIEEESINLLSNYEYKVWKGRCNGLSYEELGRKLNTNSKSIDNAIQRISMKLRRLYDLQ